MRNLVFSMVLTSISVSAAVANSLDVVVTNIQSDEGRIGCGLYDSSGSFPMGADLLEQIWIDAEAGSVRCRFNDLPSGRYAVAVSHDINENEKTDTNFLGIPKEAWGVSNNIRPSLRAPKFDEAAFLIDSTPLEIEVGIDK